MKRVLVLLLFVFSLNLLSCNGEGNPIQPAAEEKLQGTTGEITLKRDFVYKVDKEEELRFDIYCSKKDSEASAPPTVVLIHGMANTKSLKDTAIFKRWGKRLSEEGFNAIIFNWRPDRSAKDVTDFFKYIRENSDELGIDGDNIKVIAFSAGVKQGISEVTDINTGFIKSIAVFYGRVSPSILESSKEKLPPMFIAMGAADRTVPEDINDSFIEEAEKMGCNITKVVHSTGGHGFDQNDKIDETKEIINRAIMFLKNDGEV